MFINKYLTGLHMDGPKIHRLVYCLASSSRRKIIDFESGFLSWLRTPSLCEYTV